VPTSWAIVKNGDRVRTSRPCSTRPNRLGGYPQALASRLTALLAIAAIAGCGLGPVGRQVTRAEFGDAWPLTIESGTLRCQGSDAVTFETGGRTYDVSGAAAIVGGGFGEPSDPIWARDANGALKDLEPLESAAESLCM
jgi:hypothetical protein